MIERFPIIGVMGSHTVAYEAFAAPLGAWLGAQRVHLLTGGGTGSMAAVSEAFAGVPDRAGKIIGVIPTTLDEAGVYVPKPGYPNPFVEIPILTPLGPFTGASGAAEVSRNHVNVMTCDALIFLVGSKGTLNEYDLAVRFNKPRLCFGAVEDMKIFPGDAPRATKLEEVAAFLTRLFPGSFARTTLKDD